MVTEERIVYYKGDICRLTGWSLQTVNRLIYSKELSSYKIGSRVCVDAEDLMAFRARKKQEA